MSAEEYVHYLADGSTLFYTLRRRRGMKHLYLYIREGKLEVRCSPRVSFERIESFLRAKESWFLPRLRSPVSRAPDPLESFPYLGALLPVELLPDPSLENRIHLHLDEEKNRAEIRSAIPLVPSDVRELYELFYRRNAPAILAPAVKRWSERMGLSPTRLSYRRNKSRWGSCSSRGTISLNTRLLLLPEELRDYVIVHELAHLKEMNHSPAFWCLVEKEIPDWRERRKRLRDYEVYLK